MNYLPKLSSNLNLPDLSLGVAGITGVSPRVPSFFSGRCGSVLDMEPKGLAHARQALPLSYISSLILHFQVVTLTE
jgi:hypothetical protein